MEDSSVLIIGCGAAGLAAARSLSARDIPVTILEARDRPGGRIHTVASLTHVPIELGAEFIHGKRNRTREYIRRAKLSTHETPDRHWLQADSGLIEDQEFWEELEQVMGKIESGEADTDFESFLAKAKGLKERAKWLAHEYVEGFHAAPAKRMSIKALAKAEAASERADGTHQFRLSTGYSGLVQWLASQLEQAHVPIHYHIRVEELLWEAGKVEARAQTPEGSKRFGSSHALITVPLGVLKEQAKAGITFEPALVEKKQAIAGLEMGDVIKIVLEFHSRFWPVENFGFIHSKEPWLPTWWADERGTILTGWAGGPRATKLASEHPDAITAEGCRALSHIFKVEQRQIEELLAASHFHNWNEDPLSRGAYSFTPVGMTEMTEQLARPVADTLFFAGEATDADGEQGTVQAALASGERAANEIIATLRKAHAEKF